MPLSLKKLGHEGFWIKHSILEWAVIVILFRISDICTPYMKKKYFNLRLSERRLNKLRKYAVSVDKTMTQIIEELIDSLTLTESGDSSLTPFPLKQKD